MRYQGFIGGSYESESYLADQERTINWFVEDMGSEGATSARILLPTPGVEEIGTFGTGPGRAHFAEDGREWAVIGTDFGEINTAGAFTSKGTVAIGSNPATISSNGDGGGELFITSGNNGYTYDIVADTFAQVAALNGLATMGAQLDGYFLALDQATSTVYISDLLDGTTWTTGTQFFQRSIAPDPWIAMITANRYIYLLGEETSEVWYNAGVSPVPFEAHPSGLIAYGCAAAFTRTNDQGVVSWLGRTKQGAGMVVSTAGFAPEVISNFAIQNQIQSAGDLSDSTAEAYEDRGHRFLLINVPSASITYGFDLSTGKWHERGFWNADTGTFETWRPRWHAYANGQHRWLDSQTGAIYRSDSSLASDVGGAEIRRVRRAPALVFENQRIYYSALELLMDVGVGTGTRVGRLVPGSLLTGATFQAYWEFEAGGVDQFGVSDLTPVNDPTYLPAVYGNGAQLTLVTDKTDSPYFSRDISSGAFDPGTASVVFAAKFNVDSGDDRSPVVFQCRDGSTRGLYVFRRPSSGGNVMRVVFEDNSAQQTTVDGATKVTADSEFVSLVVVVNKTDDTIKLYLDGALDGSGSLPASPDTVTGLTNLLVGASDNGNQFNWDGRVDQLVYLVGRTWDAADVTTYNSLVPSPEFDPQVMMRFSNDGGRTWGHEQWRSAGQIGKYDTRVRWNRLGIARKRVYEVAVSAAVPWRLVDAFLETGQTPARISQVQAAQWY